MESPELVRRDERLVAPRSTRLVPTNGLVMTNRVSSCVGCSGATLENKLHFPATSPSLPQYSKPRIECQFSKTPAPLGIALAISAKSTQKEGNLCLVI